MAYEKVGPNEGVPDTISAQELIRSAPSDADNAQPRLSSSAPSDVAAIFRQGALAAKASRAAAMRLTGKLN